MRISQSNLNRALLTIPVLLVFLLGGSLFLLAQGSDTPIIISDGSLTIDATVPWANFQNVNARTKSHPQAAKSVTQVVVTVAGATQTFNFSNQQCTVAIQYAGTDVTVSTNNTGKAVQVTTDFTKFRAGASANLLAHTDATKKISSVRVIRGSETLFTATPSGGTRISISYR